MTFTLPPPVPHIFFDMADPGRRDESRMAMIMRNSPLGLPAMPLFAVADSSYGYSNQETAIRGVQRMRQERRYFLALQAASEEAFRRRTGSR